MIEFARKTPAMVRGWLQSIDWREHPIPKALATDERMERLWELIGDWPGAVHLTQLAVHYSNPSLLTRLMDPHRTTFGYATFCLADAAVNFVAALDFFPDTAAELWGEPVDDLQKRLWAFADAAARRASEDRVFYDFAPLPSRRGRGDAHQLLYRDAIAWVLNRLVEHHGGGFSQGSQDEIVAILASVVFPEREIDPETVRRHRERRHRRRTTIQHDVQPELSEDNSPE